MRYTKGIPYFIKDRIKEYPPLKSNIEVDVVIIGGGITGVITAYEFLKNNLSVCILEKNKLGYASTSITTALLQYELDSSFKDLRKELSEDEILLSYQAGEDALNYIHDFIKTKGNYCEYIKTGSLVYTDKDKNVEDLKNEYIFRKNNGYKVGYVNEENNEFDFNINSGVMSFNSSASLNPYLLLKHIVKLIEKNKGLIYEYSEVTKVRKNKYGIQVVTDNDYVVSCKKVIVTTGYDISMFTKKKLGDKYITYNIVTSPVEKLNKYNKVLVRDYNNPYNYYRVTKGNRIIAGGYDLNYSEDNFSEKITTKQYNKLESNIKRVYPDKEFKVDFKYCGTFMSTKDNLGYVGSLKGKDYIDYNLGYGANGILFSIIGTKILVDKYFNRTNKYGILFDINRK